MRGWRQQSFELHRQGWGGLYKLNPVTPITLESAWFQPVSLKCDILVSSFAFKCDP
jgi:hypothetical protein